MKKKNTFMLKVVGSIILVISMMSSTGLAASVTPEQPSMIVTENHDNTMSVSLSLGDYTLLSTKDGSQLDLRGFGHLRNPGAPYLPSKIVAIAIPPGAQVTDITYETRNEIQLPGTYTIVPCPAAKPLSTDTSLYVNQQQTCYDGTYYSVYGSNEAYPAQTVEFIRTAGYRKYNLVDVSVTPFSYRPLSGQLTFYPEITIMVHYTPSGSMMINDMIPETEHIAQSIVMNYDQAQAWYPTTTVQSADTYDYVIITLNSLQASIYPLAAWEMIKGRHVKIVTTTWIDNNYEGVDLAQKIRNFLIEKYPSEQWGITNVLFVGDYGDVPMRNTWQDLGYGKPDTDFYFAELSKPDSESWDKNQNQQYGETSTDPIDFYAEVSVGRIPWSDPAIVRHICEKSVAYEQNADLSFKKNILLLGAYFWEDTDNAILMEKKVNQSWMTDWTMTRMYEKNDDLWSPYLCDQPLLQENVVPTWSSGKYAFVNWAGHGSPVSSHIYGMGQPPFITAYDCPDLNDEYPAIVFGDSCSNSDTEYDNIGKMLLQQGAVGFVGATKVALGMPAWNDSSDGSSQSLDYFFTTMVTSGEYTQGAALQAALQLMYTNHLWDRRNYETFEWSALWGNPDLGMTSITEYPFLELSDVTARIGVNAVITNTGTAPAHNLMWMVSIQGGLLRRIDKTVTGTIPDLNTDDNYQLATGALTFLNLGAVDITVQAANAQKTYSAVVVGPFILRLTEI